MGDGKFIDDRTEIFSKVVKAGKRTYFFDVKITRSSDHYLTITESKRKVRDDGKFFYEKHKLFVYKEDFQNVIEGLQEAIDKINELNGGAYVPHNHDAQSEKYASDINFEDLDTSSSE